MGGHMKVLKAALWFLNWCGMMVVAAIVYVALTLFPPENRF
jgi:hypothetical protein